MTMVVALIDGPLPAGHPGLRQSRVHVALHTAVRESPAARHAAAMASAILHNAPEVQIDSHAVFPGALATSLDAVCAALEEAARSDADIVHCSFGLVRDSLRLRAATASVLNAGKRMVAAAPARGQAVYPGLCDGVTAVQGDARCGPDAWSWLGLPHAEFGACPAGADAAVRGASIGAAHFTGLLARELQAGRAGRMAELAAFHGRERITRPAMPTPEETTR